VKKVTKRDFVVFFLEIFTFFTMIIATDWGNPVQEFMDGWNSVECDNH
jgi:hypothetical protein